MSGAYSLVVRRELRDMGRDEQRRFVYALNKMAESPKGPGTSIFARLALIHALHCVHAQETFPSWHRAYLCAFEAALQQADRELGNDGNIALPYWDYCDVDRPEVTPAIIREFWSEIPGGPAGPLVPPESPADIEMAPKIRQKLTARLQQLRRIGFSEMNDDHTVCEYIKATNVESDVHDCLAAPEHWKFASKRYPRSPSIETPHDAVHMALGRPLSDLFLAGFHPMFWLLHCNVDRLLSSYIQIQGPVCAEHFRLNQEFLASQRRETNRWAAALFPFNSPLTGKPFAPAETFATEPLGYRYDKLHTLPPQRLRQPPVLAVFPNIPVMPLEDKSYTLHIFAQPDGAEFYMPDGLPTQWKSNPSYVGMGAVFGTRGAVCENCLDRKPWTLRVDITQAMTRLGLDADTADLYVFAEDEQGVVMPLAQTPIPAVEIRGALGTAPDVDMRTGASGRRVARLQRVLRMIGVDDKDGHPLVDDGDLGPLTLSAIRNFQRAAGITTEDGAAGMTLEWLNRARIDGHHVSAAMHGNALPRGPTHVVCVEELPASLMVGSNERLAKEAIARSVAAWSAVTGLKFEVVYGPSASATAAIVITFGDTDDGQVRIPTDGPGGTFATTSFVGTRRVISFDVEETWVPTAAQATGTGAKPTDPVIRVDFEAVFIHEFGHALGLPHSETFDDVMSAYYVPGLVRLTADDVALARRVYP